MQFRVPQFLEVEDKIFGPFTFKQFLYMVGGLGIAFVLYRVLPAFLAVLFIAPVLAFSGALAFYRVNNKPFIYIVEAFITFTLSNKLYLWKKVDKKAVAKKKEESTTGSYVPRLSNSKLKDLSWSLDVLDMNQNKGEDESPAASRDSTFLPPPIS